MKYAVFILALCLPTAVFTQTEPVKAPADNPTPLMDATGNDYLLICEAVVNIQPSDNFHENFKHCYGWFSGVMNGFYAYQAELKFDNGIEPTFTLPNGVTLGQLQKVVVKYMNDHPKELNKHAALLVLDALNDAYPSRSAPTKK